MKMIEAFLLSFRLKITYRTNSILYALKSTPLVKRILPDSLYSNQGLKLFAMAVAALMELGTVFLGKALYLGLMVFAALPLTKTAKPDAFVHIFFFMTLIGGLLNTQIFNPTKDKYYAMFLMGMDARDYTLSNYLYFLLKTAAGFLPFTLLFGLLAGVNVLTCLLMPLFVCGVKLILTAAVLRDCRDGEKVRNENLPTPLVWTGAAVLTAAACAPPVLGYAMNGLAFALLAVLAVAGGVWAFGYVWRFREYRAIYRTLLTPDSFAINVTASTQGMQAAYQKKIQADLSQTSAKSGYAYFNDLFMKRHSRLLTKSAKKLTVLLLAVLAAAAAACVFSAEVRAVVNGLMLTFLPYFLFVMYLINLGRGITQAMFLNCDHSMLTYRFYRQPKAILALFTARLRYVIAINLAPASVIALGLPLLLLLSGGTENPVNYLVLFVSILAMSVFFSVHTLVMYYLLQPYNISMEIKNPVYSAVNFITYFICYFAMGKEMPTLTFGILVSAFCLLYAAAALVLAYRLAPRTFKLRQ